MAIVRAKGKNADYIIELGAHFPRPFIRTKEHLKADAYILEGTLKGQPIKDKEIYASLLKTSLLQPGYREIFSEAERKNKTIWSGDISYKSLTKDVLKSSLQMAPAIIIGVALGQLIAKKLESKNRLTRRKFLNFASRIGISVGTAVAMARITPPSLTSTVAMIKKGKMPQWLLDLGVSVDDIVKTAMREGRSAVVSEKAESFIAPHLKKELGRRPTIYMFYGAGHLSIPKLIENPNYRKKILQAFSPPENYFKSPVLRDCIEFRPDGRIKIHEKVIEFPKPKKTALKDPAAKKRMPKKVSRRDLLTGRHFRA